jgi:hypothetical protein
VLLAAVIGLIISFPTLERPADAKDPSNSGNDSQIRSNWWQQWADHHSGCGEPDGDDGDNSDDGDDSDDGDNDSGNRWQPNVSDTWQWQLDGTVNTTYAVDVYDIDLFNSSEQLISELHENGHKVVCYFSAGSFEEWRPDIGDFNQEDLGDNMEDWEGERWLDIRSSNIRKIMQARLDLAVQKGCDGVEPDNIDGYSNNTGFPLTAEDQLDYNRLLAQEAHNRNLAIALKNNVEQVADLVDDFDFAVNEECHEYNECDSLTPFIEAGKPVFNAEYAYDYNDSDAMQELCTDALNRNFRTLVLPLELDDTFRYSCNDDNVDDGEEDDPPIVDTDANIIFLHHSTGANLYSQGGVASWFTDYNTAHDTDYQISKRAYPDSPYSWDNYPYDYWNLWNNGACNSTDPNTECLDTLARDYDVVIFKHCFPGADIQADNGDPNISSNIKTLENYKLQYRALKKLMESYPGTDFIVWTLAPLHRSATNTANAGRAKEFVEWVKNEWLNEGGAHPNIHVFDFWGHAAEDDPNPANEGKVNTLRYEYEKNHNNSDSHPNRLANETIGPKFAQFIIDTIQDRE